MNIVCRVTPSGFLPADRYQSEVAEKLPIGELVDVKVSRPRNIKFHKFWFAFLKTTFDMADLQLNFEQWRTLVTAGSGHADYVTNKQGKLIAVPKSIAFGSMDEDTFKQLVSDGIDYVLANYINGTREEMEKIVGFL